MIDFVSHEAERIDSRFLEPACGDGNFLIEVLKRKLKVIKNRYGMNADDYERYSIIAIASIYGVELLQDNVELCRLRLYNYWNEEYLSIFNKNTNKECQEAVKFILMKNILNGDALSLKKTTGEPIIFSEWTAMNDGLLKRRDYRLDEILEGHQEQVSIFMNDWEYDEEINAFIPKPIVEFPPIHFKKVYQYE